MNGHSLRRLPPLSYNYHMGLWHFKYPTFGSVCSSFGLALPRCLCQRRWLMAVFYNIFDLAGINARILFKEHQQQESPEESPAAAGRGAEGRMHRGESGHSRHKVGSSGSHHCSSRRHGHGGNASPKELQMEPMNAFITQLGIYMRDYRV